MSILETLPPFAEAAVAAFPLRCRGVSEQAAGALAPFVDDGYRRLPISLSVLGETVRIPNRLHLVEAEQTRPAPGSEISVMIQCLCTRSTDGYFRQAALQHILSANSPATIPFIVLLAGEYVVEIINDMVTALPTLDRDAYCDFVRENRPMMRLLRDKATSYWNCYYRWPYPDHYRQSYPVRAEYPGLLFLDEIERWADGACEARAVAGRWVEEI